MPPTLNISPSALIPTISAPSSAEILSIPQFTFYPDALDLAESRLKDKTSSLTESDLVELANRFKTKHDKNDGITKTGKNLKKLKNGVNSNTKNYAKTPRFKRSATSVKTVEKLKETDKKSETVFEILDGQHYIRTLELYGANGYHLEMKSSGIVKAERRNTKFGKLHFFYVFYVFYYFLHFFTLFYDFFSNLKSD